MDLPDSAEATALKATVALVIRLSKDRGVAGKGNCKGTTQRALNDPIDNG